MVPDDLQAITMWLMAHADDDNELLEPVEIVDTDIINEDLYDDN